MPACLCMCELSTVVEVISDRVPTCAPHNVMRVMFSRGAARRRVCICLCVCSCVYVFALIPRASARVRMCFTSYDRRRPVKQPFVYRCVRVYYYVVVYVCFVRKSGQLCCESSRQSVACCVVFGCPRPRSKFAFAFAFDERAYVYIVCNLA